jgi:hypothetical protein
VSPGTGREVRRESLESDHEVLLENLEIDLAALLVAREPAARFLETGLEVPPSMKAATFLIAHHADGHAALLDPTARETAAAMMTATTGVLRLRIPGGDERDLAALVGALRLDALLLCDATILRPEDSHRHDGI